MFNVKKFFDIKNFNHGYKKILGAMSIVLGFIALITPFTPGALWFIFIGTQLLGIHSIFIGKIEDRLRQYKGKFSKKVKVNV